MEATCDVLTPDALGQRHGQAPTFPSLTKCRSHQAVFKNALLSSLTDALFSWICKLIGSLSGRSRMLALGRGKKAWGEDLM